MKGRAGDTVQHPAKSDGRVGVGREPVRRRVINVPFLRNEGGMSARSVQFQ